MAEPDHIDDDLAAVVLASTGAQAIIETQAVQTLWSGYGQIVRCRLEGASPQIGGQKLGRRQIGGPQIGGAQSVIVKHVRWPDKRDHPRGWSTDRSHERKLRSYQVESEWYARYATQCPQACRVPLLLSAQSRVDGIVMVMEDLDASGFSGRRDYLESQLDVDVEIEACLSWLANFHATFMGVAPDGLWPTGTYWHLDTRPDELAALDDGQLKNAAGEIDRRLTDSPFQTIVHGDAKLANFCFSADGRRAAAVDFQYVGGGCGMKDVAYFIGSCLDEEESERFAPELLDRYFELLADALERSDMTVDVAAIEADWRALYPVAWTDFYRFLQGWSPGHWKLHRYSERVAREVLESL